jgi:predicted dithiol-disulfide oxidoreductase (DUF899 family)
MAFPEVVPREQWLEARLRLLAEEKKETRRRDALNAERRRLPMVRIEKEYLLEGSRGPVTLAGLLGGGRQLIIHRGGTRPRLGGCGRCWSSRRSVATPSGCCERSSPTDVS